jgi:DNA-binding LacI/PurR family transcriptional regulator
MGRRAVDLLLAQLRGESVPNLSIVPFELVDAEGN